MKRLSFEIVVHLLTLTSVAWAGGPCQLGHIAAPALTVVPFAIPVAVPVATVSYPSVLYGVRESLVYPPLASERRGAVPSGSSLDAVTILTRHCAVCHSAPTPQGERTFFHADGKLLDKLPRQLILDAFAGPAATMPPAGRAKLTAIEFQVIRDWAVPPRDLAY